MEKSTVFFSHSSKDRDMVLYIKDKLEKATGKALKFFMSSDGQSIPVGTNWIHKIEEGLEQAQIMFVFITDNSIKSGWIYFEAGYAYSKGIRVIPVGIGVDIGLIKAPLNMLQGFNINTPDSLNNFISTINTKFDCEFVESFNEYDYAEIMKNITSPLNRYVSVEDLCIYEKTNIYSKYSLEDGTTITIDLDSFYNKLLSYLNDNTIEYAFDESNTKPKVSRFLFQGIQIQYFWKRDKEPTSMIDQGERAKIQITLSPYNFIDCFSILIDLMNLISEESSKWLWFYFQHKVKCITSSEDISSILSAYPEEFKSDKRVFGCYMYVPLGLSFKVLLDQTDNKYILSIQYDSKKATAQDVIVLLNRLLDIKLISIIPDNAHS